MRNIAEHADDYAIDSPKRHVKTVDRRQLEVGQWDGTTFRWLQEADGAPHQLNIDVALAAAEDLCRVLRGNLAQAPEPNETDPESLRTRP